MQVSVENTSNLGRTLKITIPAATVEKKRREKIVELSKKVKLNGFRNKGMDYKVMEKAMEQRYGASIQKELVSDLVNSSFTEALKEKDLKPITMPRFKDVKNDDGLEYLAEIEIQPVIELSDFSKLKFEKQKAVIDNKDIEEMVDKLRKQHAKWVELETPVEKDNRVKVDFYRTVKEENAQEEQDLNKYMVVGSKGALKELNDALIGKKKGEEFSIEVNYPADWSENKVAGKTATLRVKVLEVANANPLKDEELVKLFNIEGGMDELRKELTSRMESEAEQLIFNKTKEEVLEQILKNHEVDLPVGLVEEEKRKLSAENEKSAEDKKQTEQELDEQAKRSVTLGLLLNAIREKYELKADANEVRAAIERIAVSFPDPNYVLQAYYGNERLLASVENQVVMDHAIKKVISEADLTEIETPFAKIIEKSEEVSA